MTEQENEITTSGASDTATSEGATTPQQPNAATEYPSGSAEAVQGEQGSGFQKPADPSVPRPGGASFNSEGGFSDSRNAPVQTPRANMTENRDVDRDQAASTDPNTVHSLRGMQIGTPVVDSEGNPTVGSGMIGGGSIAAEHLPPGPPASPADLLRQWTRRAMQSPHFATLAGVAGRPVSEWGLFGKGVTVRGLMLGINVDTLDKEIFHDGHVIERDGVWANARNFPEDAIAGDNLKQLAGSR